MQNIFVMVIGYFDDSGTDAINSVQAVGGYLGSVAQWERFNVEWAALLKQFDVAAMHRSDLECFQGDFLDWAPEQRDRFVNKAQQIIKRRTYQAIGNTVIKADFDSEFPAELKQHYGGAYGYCAMLCIARASKWCDKVRQSDPIDWIFEAGTAGATQINTMMKALYSDISARRRFRINGWSVKDKRLLPLQSADVMAYECFKFVTEQIFKQSKRKVRKSFEHLVRSHDDNRIEHWSRDRLREYVESPVAQALVQGIRAHGIPKL